jgi:NarL family two-component system response regulator YdfI
MSNNTNRRATGGKNKKEQRPRGLRVLIASALPMTSAGLEALLRRHRDLEVIVSSGSEAHLADVLSLGDVLLIDAHEFESADGDLFAAISRWSRALPVVALVASPPPGWISRTLHAGARGLLPHGVSGDDLASALRASVAGMVVLSQEFSDILFASSLRGDDEAIEPAESLTPREQEVLVMMAEGLLNKEIADRLRVSEHTVKFHVSSIMAKLGASSRTEAVTRGIRRGLLFV